MIEPQNDGTVRITVSAAAAFKDGFEIANGTRPLDPDWVKLQLEIRPDFDHPSVIRRLSTLAGDAQATAAAPEIVVHDADRALFSFAVPQTVTESLLRRPDGSAARYTHILRALYASAADTDELWRGEFIVLPGLTP